MAKDADDGFNITLHKSNWEGLTAAEVEAFLNAHLKGKWVREKTTEGKSVAIKVFLHAPRGGSDGTSTEVAYVLICPMHPCVNW